MNLFLADKVASYLSGATDLSLYKNSLTLNTASGELAVNHHFYNPKEEDMPARSFFSLGAKANIFDAYTAATLSRKFNNGLGFMVKYNRMGKTRTTYTCGPGISGVLNHKAFMDAQRAIILLQLEKDIQQKSYYFEQTIDSLCRNLAVTDTTGYKQSLRQEFYTTLEQQSIRAFNDRQSDVLLRTESYNRVSTSWTSLFIYTPVLTQHATVAGDLRVVCSTGKITRFLPVSVKLIFGKARNAAGFF